MMEIRYDEGGAVVLSGRLDTAQAERAQQFMDQIAGSCDVDMSGLEYISSAGLGVLMRTQKRLMGAGGGLRLVNVNRHIREMFRYAGFDQIFEVVPPAGE